VQVVSKEVVDVDVGAEDDVDYVPESQLEDFVSGLIVTPPSDHVPPSRKKRVLRSLRRNLAQEFEEDVDEGPTNRSRRTAADTAEGVVDEGSGRRAKFVVLEDD